VRLSSSTALRLLKRRAARSYVRRKTISFSVMDCFHQRFELSFGTSKNGAVGCTRAPGPRCAATSEQPLDWGQCILVLHGSHLA
jgi:hypothetical protein